MRVPSSSTDTRNSARNFVHHNFWCFDTCAFLPAGLDQQLAGGEKKNKEVYYISQMFWLVFFFFLLVTLPQPRSRPD